MSTGFKDLVEREFSFLEVAGFRKVDGDSGQVTYRSDRSMVSITWDRRSGELEVWIAPVADAGASAGAYAFSDVLGLAGLPEDEARPAQVADENRLQPFIADLAGKLRTHAAAALAGDPMYFRRLEVFRSQKAHSSLRALQLRQARAELEKAWTDRQYDRVISLCAVVGEDLTESEAFKLDYSKKHRLG